MTNRTRVVLGSLAGALAIHVGLVACSGAPPAADPDGGMLANLRDVVADILGAEVPDARAGGDGGAPACNCPQAAPEYTLRIAGLALDGRPETPMVDYSYADLFSTPALAFNVDDPSQSAPQVVIRQSATVSLANGSPVSVTCADIRFRPDRSLIGTPDCTLSVTRARGDAGPGTDFRFTGSTRAAGNAATIELVRLTDTDVELRLAAVRVALRGSGLGSPGPTLTADSITITAHSAVGGYMTPPRALRP